MANFTDKQYLDMTGLTTLVGQIKAEDTKIKNMIGEVAEGSTVVSMIAEATYDDTNIKKDISDAAGAASGAKDAADAAQGTADEALEKINTFMNAAEVGEAAVDTLKEIQAYIESDGGAAKAMADDIEENAKAIAAIEERLEAPFVDLDADVASSDVESGKGLKVSVSQVDGKLTSVTVAGDFNNAYDAKGSANEAYGAIKAISSDSINALFN